MFLSCMRLGVAPRTDIKKTCKFKKIELCVHNMITIIGSMANVIEEHARPLYEHNNLHFDHE
jgi:hypothetical protein